MAPGTRPPVPISALVIVSGTSALTAHGFVVGGWWQPNVHNGLLAVAFGLVGAYVLRQRPGHAVGELFVATGAIQAVMFTGRQIGRSADSTIERWWAWIGVWPIAIALAAVTLCVLLFPDGRLPSPKWRPVAIVIAALGIVCSTISALWPVEYESAGITAAPPFTLPGADAANTVWSAIAHPTYIAFQVLWVVALTMRWRASHGAIRRQVLWLVAAAGASVVALVVGLAVAGSPRLGLLFATLLPVAAGWSIVYGQHVSARRALSWLSRTSPKDDDLPNALCAAAAHALGAPKATLWIGADDDLRIAGGWPDDWVDDVGTPTTLDALLADPQLHARPVRRGDHVIGALGAHDPTGHRLTTAEQSLFDDLASQAALVIEHLNLAHVMSRKRAAEHLDELTPREREVLQLMARGLSNAAICEQLHLSIKSVEPVISSIFMKLDLHADAASNRRVLAVLAYVQP